MNFQVELTSVCDLECGYCPNRSMERERSFMTNDVFDAILHKYIVPYRTMNLNPGHRPTFIGHKDGEPLLNKKILKIWQQLSDTCPDINIDIYSHGLMLQTWQNRGQDVFDFLATLPNRCRYLMSYHPFNHDGSVNDYANTNLYMQEMLRNRKPHNVEVIMVSHLSKHVTIDQMNEWKESWQEIVNNGLLTVHANVGINPWTGLIEDEHCTTFNGCPYADFGSMFFGVSGNVIACCMDLEEEIVFGNVLKDDPAKMVDKLAAFYVEQQRIGREKTGLFHEVCRDCMGMGKRTDLIQLGAKA